MVAHNAVETIGDALSSLLLQGFPDWQCHIVDDASADGTGRLLERLTDSRFMVQHSARRLGRAGARNLALKQASGTYLASLDADDFLFPNALQSLVGTLEKEPGLSACTGSLLLFAPDLRPLGRRRTQIAPGKHRVFSPLTTRLPLGSTMIRRSLVAGNRFNEVLRRSEDRDFFDRILCGTELQVLPEPTYAYRWSLSLENVMEGLRNRETLFWHRLPASPARACLQIAWTRWKRLCYPALSSWGYWELLNRWRAVPVTLEESALFRHTLLALREKKVFTSP